MDNNNEEVTRIISGLDILDVINFVTKKNKRFQAIFLKDLEDIIGKNDPKYLDIRKLCLDWSNDYTRSILRIIFGTDFEGQIK